MRALRRRFQPALLALLALAPVLGAHAAERDAWHEELEAQLAARNDPNSLATAAAIDFALDAAPQALELAARAAELAPQSAAIGWLHLQLCAAYPTCAVRDVATVLRWVDANNAASWLPMLALAAKEHDVTEVDRVIADMAQTGRFDVYANRWVVVFADAMRHARSGAAGRYDNDLERFEAARELVQSEVLPGFAPLREACRPAAAQRRASCLKLAILMQHGDSIATQLAGMALEKRLVPSESKPGRALAERKHELEACASGVVQLESVPQVLKIERIRTHLALLRRYSREEDVCLAMLRSHRLPDAVENHR